MTAMMLILINFNNAVFCMNFTSFLCYISPQSQPWKLRLVFTQLSADTITIIPIVLYCRVYFLIVLYYYYDYNDYD